MRKDLPPPPEISDDFTMEDIHKIRDYHYELSKILTWEEQKEMYRKASEDANRRIAEIRAAGIKPVYPKRIEI